MIELLHLVITRVLQGIYLPNADALVEVAGDAELPHDHEEDLARRIETRRLLLYNDTLAKPANFPTNTRAMSPDHVYKACGQ